MNDNNDQYFILLKQAVISSDPEEALTAAADLGRDFLKHGILPEDYIEIHHHALLRLAQESPDIKFAQVADRLMGPLMEVSMAYSLAFRQQLEQKEITRGRQAQASRLEAIGTMAAGIAHDFNTILGIINGYAELLSDDYPDDTIGQKNVQHIIAASFRARDLIGRMLAFARQKLITPIPVDAVALIKEALEMMRITLPSGIKIAFETELQYARMLADPSQIHQIVMNLCMNAADAMDGKGAIEIAIKRAPLQKDSACVGPRFCLVVADDGCGMAPEVQQRVLDPFYTTKAPGKGSGLGLSIIYGIVSDLGGEFHIQSQLGAGSRFNIILPLIEQDSPSVVLEK
ncbi:MAG: ATP-binding protein [Undibacterium sp.]|uniref:sensor histidine kinase n=1 Tax=Undibacterium sp. TaxID=1914977 RepID=UPI002726E9D2|nr:ATP-binding protein [Undibacterium sp.]MDO8652220.1 ATP-binding protein [Undibacterium sp.]